MIHTFEDIPYQLLRSSRKTASISVERDGQVLVRLPENSSESLVPALLEQKRQWIYKQLATWRNLNAKHKPKQYVGGESFLYLGRVYRLRVVEEQCADLVLKGDYFYLRAGVRDPKDIFKNFYRLTGQPLVSERVAHFAPQLGVTVEKVKILELHHRWASCSKKGLNFHWKTIMAPRSVLDYLVVHELSHLLYPRHDTMFWSTIAKVLPNFTEQKIWLRENGVFLSL